MVENDRCQKEKIKRVASLVFAELVVPKNVQKLHARCDVIRDGRRPREASIRSWEKGIVCPDWRAP
jgi:hypothetical protein